MGVAAEVAVREKAVNHLMAFIVFGVESWTGLNGYYEAAGAAYDFAGAIMDWAKRVSAFTAFNRIVNFSVSAAVVPLGKVCVDADSPVGEVSERSDLFEGVALVAKLADSV